MTTRKTLDEAKAEGGYLDQEKFDSLSDTDIDRLIAADPDLAPATGTLPALLEIRDVRRKLGLSQHQFATRLGIPVAKLRGWERGPTPADPTLQALLRILDRIPEPALQALGEPVQQAK